jgi:glycosyltransferase involved in cell wall biosynthesis
MKILVICTAETWGGLEQTAFRDIVELNKQGISAELLCFDEGVILEQARKAGLKYHVIKNRHKYFNFDVFLKIRCLVKNKKFDLIHLHTFNTILPILLAVMKLDVFVIATRHIYVEHVKKDFLHKFLLRRIDMLLAISDFARANLLQTYPLPKEKIKTLYIGIDVNFFAKSDDKTESFLSSNPKLRSASNVIGMVARIDPMKGQLEFLEAARMILNKDSKAMFVIVGAPTVSTDTCYLDMIKQKTIELGIDDKVVFTGFCEDVSEALSVMDVFVMPSYFEAFGLTVLQAMANKTPIVSTDKGSIKEIIPSNDYGIVIPAKNSLAIAESVINLLSDKKKMKNMAEISYKRVCSIFDQKIYFEKLMSIYKRNENVKKRKKKNKGNCF